MSRIPIPATIEDAPEAAQDGLRAIQAAQGKAANLHRTIARSPATLAAYLAMGQALDTGTLDPAIARRIAIGSAQTNGAEYCLAIQCTLGRAAGLTPAEIEAARLWHSRKADAAAALSFAEAVLTEVGHVPSAIFADVRASGLSDEAMVEIVGHVAMNVMANYIASAFDLEIDYPAVEPLES
ncbi:MAG: carboxymuconolactone decarboxylase family protein [Pseudomonadota bacterium]